MAKKRISIKDIAEVAGVSHPTVSRALRGQGRMSESTRERILDVAKELGYAPSLMARGLVMQRSFCVGLIVPTFLDPFHSEVAQGVEEWARRHHYSLFVSSTDLDPKREMEVAHSFLGRQVDGIIVSSSCVGDQYVEMSRESDIPIVLINPQTDSTQIHTVAHDDYSGGLLLMEHLIQQGHRNIAHLGVTTQGRAHHERKQAWIDSMRKADLSPKLSVDCPAGSISGGMRGGAQLLQKALEIWQAPPDAIFCYNDAAAIGVIAALRDAGYAVPDAVAITGFDDLDIAAAIEPALTTIHQPRRDMGVLAMRTLLSLIDQIHPQKDGEVHSVSPSNASQLEQISTLVPGRMIIRRSA
ncbi:MAG: LacI family DNA-binding transcriptional regulator [Caldilineaceae bacterium]